jgi:hypothetical protein
MNNYEYKVGITLLKIGVALFIYAGFLYIIKLM